MALTDYDFVKYDPKQMEHIDRHLSGSETVGSHFMRGAFPTAKDLVDYAVEHIQDYDGERLVREIHAGRDIGYDALVLLSDVSNGFNIVTREPRGKPEYLVNIVRGFPYLPKPKTRNMTIVAGPLREGGKHGFYTIFPGKNAPSFPVSREDLIKMGYSGEELEKQVGLNAQYKNFWDKHGFIAD